MAPCIRLWLFDNIVCGCIQPAKVIAFAKLWLQILLDDFLRSTISGRAPSKPLARLYRHLSVLNSNQHQNPVAFFFCANTPFANEPNAVFYYLAAVKRLTSTIAIWLVVESSKALAWHPTFVISWGDKVP
jgi:2-oxoglutarate dehydrogenase complex dehydrogenase (E1) component-like enzyme